ncbi:hypothetical protein [Morganella morganii]|uniref:hypothetical protein n=1 Tax=Morganella morganii TaxID=582 RepID=UPI0022A3329C|nr:hypothetical protein [Morganella morganii]
MEFDFEKIPKVDLVPEEVAYATPVLFSILAQLITDGDSKKQEELYKLIDNAVKMNDGATVKDTIATIGQMTKFSLSGK